MLSHKLRLALIIFGLGLGLHVQATPTWNRVHAQHGLSTANHAFCFQGKNGDLIGSNPHLKVRLASVSKMITTLWVLEKKGPTFQYENQFFYKDGHLHIKGSKDTIFSRRKLFTLVNQLNNLEIKQISKMTFDENTIVFAGSEGYVGEVLTITANRTATNLKDFLHTPGWERLKPAYQEFYRQTPQAIIDRFDIRELSELDLSVASVEPVSQDPFPLNGDDVIAFSSLSPAIQDYMKVMNIVSNNFVADQTFANLGGEEAFDHYIKDFLDQEFPRYEETRQGFSANEQSIKMFTGSGLNTTRDGSRVDNFSSCAIVIKLMQRLQDVVLELETSLDRVAAVPGTDRGTFRNRLNSQILKNSMVAKTGTLYHTSALAGILSTKEGMIPFGIFHQLTGSKATAVQIQNQMVRTLVDQYGGPASFDYRARYFFPVAHEKID
jgi:serine-type D-Ala-D-Ala carboxypeptidase/endopeptidase (penicillin-binding protein 4)